MSGGKKFVPFVHHSSFLSVAWRSLLHCLPPPYALSTLEKTPTPTVLRFKTEARFSWAKRDLNPWLYAYQAYTLTN